MSCNTPTDIGRQLQQVDVLGSVTMIDTLAIRTSNMLLDSLATDPLEYFYNNTGANNPTRFNLLVGNYKSTVFGDIEASSYVQFLPYSSIPAMDNTYSCDSVVLKMYYNSNSANGYYPYNISNSGATKYYYEYTYGDTTQPHTLKFYEPTTNLASTISAPTTKSPIVSTDLLGSIGPFIPSPVITTGTSTNILRAKLNNSLGDRFIANIVANQSDFTSNFKNYFNGIAIVPDANNTAVLGFASRDNLNLLGPFITVYYHIGTSTTTGSIEFKAASSGFAFNRVTSSRSSSANLSSLQNPYDSISTDLTGNLCFIQAGSGLSVKVSLPHYLSFVNSTKEKLAVTNASLIIKRSSLLNTDDGGPDHKLPPPYLTLYALGEDNKPYKYSTTNMWQTITTDRSSLNPVRALYDNTSKSYTLDITNYLQNQSLTNKTPRFIITAGFNNQLVNGLVFGDAKSSDNPMKLKLYYARVKL